MTNPGQNRTDDSAPLDRRCHWGLYAIIDAKMAGRPHGEVCRELVKAGVRVMQLRDKQATFEELMEIGAELRTITREAGATLIINDNPYLAREIDADGVHIGQDDFPPDIVREVMGPDKIIGLSTHSKQQAIAATTWPIDYIGVGPVYPTSSKASTYKPVGTSLIRWVRKHVPLPTVAIGGITEATVPDALAAGASNVAMIGELMKADDIAARAAQLRELAENFVDWK
jgi:thiamine-phosphate pyrophosphorylase